MVGVGDAGADVGGHGVCTLKWAENEQTKNTNKIKTNKGHTPKH